MAKSKQRSLDWQVAQVLRLSWPPAQLSRRPKRSFPVSPRDCFTDWWRLSPWQEVSLLEFESMPFPIAVSGMTLVLF